MIHHVNFTPGPSQLYFTVADHARHAFKEGIPSLSHRSKVFENIFHETVHGLRELLNLPSSYQIYFTGSATEIWERIIQNLVEQQSLHLVNGSFSKKFYETATQLDKKPIKIESKEGEAFDYAIDVPEKTELIALTHNETSTGVSLPLDFIYKIRSENPETLIAVDAVSSLPYPEFDYTKVDSVFFSVQKGFGLPAGLGVWLVNERCVAKAASLLAKGISIGSYHTIPSLKSNADKNQTPETPNTLGIHLLNCVIKDFLRRGIQNIRRETEYKAAILYNALEENQYINAFVKDKKIQSKTVIVADCQEHTESLAKYLQNKGLYPGDGYGPSKKTQLRFANFPAHSKEQYELLVDTIAEFNPKIK